MASNGFDQSPDEKMPSGTGGEKAGDVEVATRPTPVITAPSEALHRQERERREPLVRLVALCIMVVSLLLVPAGLIPSLDAVTLIALGILLAGSLLAYILNQIDAEIGATMVLLAGIALAIAWEILARARLQGGVDMSDLRLFDLFAVLIVLSGMLVGRKGTILTGVATMSFTLAALVFLPHTEPLQQFWNGIYPFANRGSPLDVISLALALQVSMVCISWLSATSVRNALQGALRADDLQAANEQIQIQARILVEQRGRLHEGIAQIQQVHAAVARGQWDARAGTASGELLPIAISLNLLLDRLGRLSRDHETLARVNCTAQELAQALQQMRHGYPYVPPAYTGTSLDEVLVELAYLRSARPPVARSHQLTGGELNSDSGSRQTRPLPRERQREASRTVPLAASSYDGPRSRPIGRPGDPPESEFDWLSWLRTQGNDRADRWPPY